MPTLAQLSDDEALHSLDYPRRALAHHSSGALYVVEYCSVWQGDRCLGGLIIAGRGPVSATALGLTGSPPYPPQSPSVFDPFTLSESEQGTAWLQAEADAGRLTYPIAARGP